VTVALREMGAGRDLPALAIRLDAHGVFLPTRRANHVAKFVFGAHNATLSAVNFASHEKLDRIGQEVQVPATDCCPGEARKMIRLKVNGVERSFDDDPTMPLLWYLRDELALTGTKFGCGMSLCGACTVHLNGKAVRSCVTQMRQLENAEVTTIEGISAKGPHPVQRAWMQLNVPQCGYCQSGQIMSAVALLSTNRDPSDQQIDEAMSGNICRCGTYQRIRAAIKAAAEASREHD